MTNPQNVKQKIEAKQKKCVKSKVEKNEKISN